MPRRWIPSLTPNLTKDRHTQRSSRRFFRKRTLWPTPEGTRFLLLMGGILLAAVNTGNNLIYLLLAMMLSLIVLSGILSEQSLRKIRIYRRFPLHLFAGQPFSLRLRLENGKRYFPSFSIRLREVWAGPVPEIYFTRIPPHGAAVQRLTLQFRRRGRYLLTGARLSTTFPFSLFVKSRFPEDTEEILVYPPIHPLPSSLLRGMARAESGRELSKGAGAVYRGLRDYRLGDDSRAIHWKVTARQRRLIIREYEAESGNRVTLIFKNILTAAGPPHREAFERAVELTASLAALWIRQGFWIRLISAEETIPFGLGTGHLYRILRHLAVIAPVGTPTESIPVLTESAYLIQCGFARWEGDWPGTGPWQTLSAEAFRFDTADPP